MTGYLKVLIKGYERSTLFPHPCFPGAYIKHPKQRGIAIPAFDSIPPNQYGLPLPPKENKIPVTVLVTPWPVSYTHLDVYKRQS